MYDNINARRSFRIVKYANKFSAQPISHFSTKKPHYDKTIATRNICQFRGLAIYSEHIEGSAIRNWQVRGIMKHKPSGDPAKSGGKKAKKKM